jgi:hypothetical protein
VTAEQAKALADYWAALTPEQHKKAYRRMMELGMPDYYATECYPQSPTTPEKSS